MEFLTVNPATSQILSRYEYLNSAEVDQRIDESFQAYQQWSRTSVTLRAQVLQTWAQRLMDLSPTLVQSITLEMGKPVVQAKAEVDKCIFTLKHLATHGADWLTPRSPELEGRKVQVEFRPLGPILAIMPWNFPLWQVIRCAGPALLAGNTILMKHSDRTAGTAEILAHTAKDLWPGGDLLANVRVSHDEAARMIRHPHVRAVSFTGSTRGGSEVAQVAGAAIKKCVLELGGSDPYLVMEDANLEDAAKTCAASRLQNAGQSCVAAKRFLVHENVFDRFVGLMEAEFATYVPADPAKPNTRIGPLAAMEFREQLEKQLQMAVKWGGHVRVGGRVPEIGPCFYEPTIVTFQSAPDELGRHEMFGPVACVVPFKSEEEALQIANDSVFGLGGAVFSRDERKARALAARIETGSVAINDMVKSDIRAPFGGVKQSGWGRELSEFGIHEFCNIQTIG